MAAQPNIHPTVDPQVDPLNSTRIYIMTPFGNRVQERSPREIREQALSNYLYMRNSNSYKDININLGVFTKTDIIDEWRRLQQENLQAKQTHLLKQIAQMKEAATMEEIQKVNRDQYNDVTVLGAGRYDPVLVVGGEQKFPVYATLVQEIDKHGYGAFKTKMGIRNFLVFTDRMELSYQKAISRHDAHNYGAKWSIPYKKSSSIGVEGSYNFHRLFRGLDHGVSSYSAFYSRHDLKVDVEVSDRVPQVDTYGNPHDFNYFSSNYSQPSKKKSLKVWKLLYNRLEDGDVRTGDYMDASGQVALPLGRDHASFFRFDLNYRRYWDLCGASHSTSQLSRKLNRYTNLELAYSMSAIYRRTNFVSDSLPALMTRGFETQQTPNTSPLNFKLALKYNIYNFPLLSRANIRVFSYLSNAVSMDWHEKSIAEQRSCYRPTWRAAVGFGAYYQLMQSARLELIYNVMQWQNKASNAPTNFQIRIGIND